MNDLQQAELEEPEVLDIGVNRRRYLSELQRRARKTTILSAMADALVELDLTDDEIRAHVQRLFSEPAA